MTTREDRCSHSRSHDKSGRKLEGMVRTREYGHGQSLSHDESDRALEGMHGKIGIVTASLMKC